LEDLAMETKMWKNIKKSKKKRKDKLDDLAKEISAAGVGKISQKYSIQ